MRCYQAAPRSACTLVDFVSWRSPLTSRLFEAGYTINNRSERLRRRFEFFDRQLSALPEEASVLGHFLGVTLANNAAVVNVSMSFLEGPSQHQQLVL